MYKRDDFTTLHVRTTQAGRYVWLKTLKATAELYGWDKEFKTLIQQKFDDSPDGFIPSPHRKGWGTEGGVLHRISRSPKTSGWPAGTTNSFRLSRNATMLDLAEVAKSTQVDWHWITCKHGGRRTREWFEQTSPT